MEAPQRLLAEEGPLVMVGGRRSSGEGQREKDDGRKLATKARLEEASDEGLVGGGR